MGLIDFFLLKKTTKYVVGGNPVAAASGCKASPNSSKFTRFPNPSPSGRVCEFYDEPDGSGTMIRGCLFLFVSLSFSLSFLLLFLFFLGCMISSSPLLH